MSYTLIIAEKPAAAQKIAYALGKTEVKRAGKVSYFKTQSNGDTLIVVSAVGHLFGLAAKEKGKYPIFDLEWKPLWKTNKKAAFSKPYAETIEKLAAEAEKFIVATDYDTEGEVIGLNALRFLCHKQDAMRMKFSTLTASDLKQAYDEILPTLDWGQAGAGEARHYLDWIWGINLSHAAMAALMEVSFRKTLSIGRVQGPALAFLAKRELEIQKFIPKPYWQLSIKTKTNPEIEAFSVKGDFTAEKEAKKIFDKIRDKPARVAEIKTTEEEVLPPVPFDLTSLQMEAWRCFRISPKYAQQIAQELYTMALISYPRTSSQKLPVAINYKKILGSLGKQAQYAKFAEKIFSLPRIKPREGAKSDPAHPAIYPTGEFPKTLDVKQRQVYDLVVRRFFAVFAESATKEVTKVSFDVEKEFFNYTGNRITEEGWREFYGKYSPKVEGEIPALRTNEVLQEKTQFYSKKTKPPSRYTSASIIRELEKRVLGTKSTRANIIDTLQQRGYIKGTSIEVTKLGLEIIKIFEKYAPDILEEQLTRDFEEDMELIRERKKTQEEIYTKAKKVLAKILNIFNLHRAEIGKELSVAVIAGKREESVLMPCPKCGKGDFKIIVSRKSGKRFLACSKYPDCKTAWPLPQMGLLKILQEKHTCGTPCIQIIKKGQKPWVLCPNPNCRVEPTPVVKKEQPEKTETKG